MEHRTPCEVARAMEVSITSRKLWDTFDEITAYDEDVQNQLSDVMMDFLQCSRLTNLPLGVLSTIYRKAGRHTRRVAPSCKATYGPLDCGLHLDTIDLDHLLAPGSSSFDHVTALIISAASCRNTFPAGTFTALPTILPKLQSLHLDSSFESIVTLADIKALQRLGSCLTSLTLPTVAPLLSAISNVLHLRSLRSFSFKPPKAAVTSDICVVTHMLSCLSDLRQLQLTGDSGDDLVHISAHSLLSSLSRLTCLTSLNLHGLRLSNWDDQAAGALRAILPQLSALTLLTDDMSWEPYGSVSEPWSQTEADGSFFFMGALAQGTALTSLELELKFLPREEHNLAALSSLKLVQLGVLGTDGFDRIEVLLGAMEVQRTLRALHMDIPCCYKTETWSNFATLAGGLETLRMNSPPHVPLYCFNALAGMTRLTRLAVNVVVEDGDIRGQESYTQLSALRQLRVLEIKDVESNGRGLRAALGVLSCLTSLRQLDMCCENDFDTAPTGWDSELWQVASLRHTLTSLTLVLWDLSGNVLGCVLCRLTALQRLSLSQMQLLQDPCLPEYLLPLPPTLRTLSIHGPELQVEALAELQTAAHQQDCVVRARVM